MTTESFNFTADDIYPRQRALFDQVESYLFARLKSLHETRGRFWNRDYSSPEAYARSVEVNRQHFLATLGGWPWQREELAVQRETVRQFDKFRLDRVSYRIFTGLQTDALLLVPNDVSAGKKRPAILCQVGVNGTPERICGFDGEAAAEATYHSIGRRLAEHGYVVIATRMITGTDPKRVREQDHRALHLMTGREPEIRQYILETYGKDESKKWATYTNARVHIDRMCRLAGGSIYGLEFFALSRAIDLLGTLPEVDAERIGMYGLSQGGLSAVWLPALETRIKASASSAFFNERFTKQLVRTEHNYPFLFSSEEYHMLPMLAEFSDADLASLICPRCFFVECGRKDDAVYWEQSVAAFRELKAHYDRLGIPDRCEHRLHEGGHETEPLANVADIAAVKFLDRWLR
jgi:dienelactone hydrolase